MSIKMDDKYAKCVTKSILRADIKATLTANHCKQPPIFSIHSCAAAAS